MEVVSGYHIVKTLMQGRYSVLCRAVHLETGTRWLLKIPAGSLPASDPAYLQECETMLAFDDDCFLRFEPFETETSERILRAEDRAFVLLSACERYHGASLAVFFEAALELTNLLGEIHQRQIVYRQLCPDKVLVSRETGQLYLADFSLATRFNEEWIEPNHHYLHEQIVPYMSPEQTGRMNRGVDYRSDFYSLGVVLYEMMAGTLPFDADDLGGWIHAHLAKRPLSLMDQNDSVPSSVSLIVDKLLAKHPEERYQSASGLAADITACRRQKNNKSTGHFVAGQFDRSITMNGLSAFIGRDEEFKLLQDTFQEVVYGSGRMICITGASGVGKTELVHHFMAEEVAKDGIRVLYGKSEHLKTKIPYEPLIQVFKTFLEQLLAEPEDILVEWKEQITEALGDNSGILANFIPEIEVLLGSSPEVPDLPPDETENRLNLVFQNFVDVLTKSSPSIWMIFDDLQWADTATLKWIEEVSVSTEKRHVSILAIYRDGVLSNIHPLRKILERIKEAQGNLPILTVQPFTLQETSLWLATVLGEKHAGHRRLQILAEQLCDKTGGSPLFLRQLLLDVYEKGQVFFQHRTGSWQWDVDQIENLSISDDVAGLTLGKLEKMRPEMKHLLHAAACIGFQFRYALLASVCPDIEEPRPLLQKAINEGIMTRQTDSDREKESYTFLHDQIWRAAYLLGSEDTSNHFHFRIGQLLLREGTKNEGMLFPAVYHLNKGLTFVENEQERTDVAKANLAAARKARMSVLYKESLDYAECGLKWLNRRAEYPDARALLIEKAQALFLNGSFEEADRMLTDLLDQSNDVDARMAIYSLKIHLYDRMREDPKVQEIGIQALRELGIDIPLHPSKARILVKYLRIKKRVNKRIVQTEVKLPPDVRNQPFLWEMRFAEQLSQTIYITDQNLWAFMSLEMLEIALKRGQEEDFPSLMMTYAIFVMAGFSDVETGYRCGRWSSRLNSGDNYAKGYVHFSYGSFVHAWKHHPKSAIPYLQKSARINMTEGRLMIASAAMNMEVLMMVDAGIHLSEVLRKIDEYCDLAAKLKFFLFREFIQLIRDNVLYLYEPDRAEKLPPKPLAQSIDPSVYEEELRTIMFSVSRIQTLYWLGRYDMLCAEAKIVEPLIGMKFKFLSTVDFHFYYAMGLLQTDVENGEWKDMKRQRNRLQFFAKKMPHYAGHLYHLVLAEINRVRGNHGRALGLYDRALEAAAENDFPNIVALAAERKGAFHQSLGQLHAATRYFTLAHQKAEECGIHAKSAVVNRKHRFRQPDQPYRIEDGTDVDLASLMKSSVALSKEIRLDRLVGKLLRIALENAGAMKGSLILVENNTFFIVAEARGEEGAEKVQPLTLISLSENNHVSQTVIHFTARTKKPLVVDDLMEDERFSDDPYIAEYEPKSVLCLPIVTQNKLVGLLYLENGLANGAFLPDRVKILELLSSEMAVSIVNARLYTEMEQLNSHLEEKVKERTKHLEESQEETASALAEKSILEERQHIAKEVHDVVSHTMTTAMVQMEVAKKLAIKDMSQAQEKMSLSQELLRKGMKGIRESVEMLGADVGEYAFVPELNKLIRETETHGDVQINTSIENIAGLSAGQKRLLVQVLREGLTNGIRHGQSSCFDFTLKEESGSITFRLKDDGRGFDEIEYGFGLRSMQKRIEDFHGNFSISSPGNGCLLEITLPKPL